MTMKKFKKDNRVIVILGVNSLGYGVAVVNKNKTFTMDEFEKLCGNIWYENINRATLAALQLRKKTQMPLKIEHA